MSSLAILAESAPAVTQVPAVPTVLRVPVERLITHEDDHEPDPHLVAAVVLSWAVDGLRRPIPVMASPDYPDLYEVLVPAHLHALDALRSSEARVLDVDTGACVPAWELYRTIRCHLFE
jgi:hypothetical protein